MIRAAKKDTVKVHYTGRLQDGTIFDKSPEDRPLKFIINRNGVATIVPADGSCSAWPWGWRSCRGNGASSWFLR